MKKTLITVLGWEERSIKGFFKNFEEYKFFSCLIFIYKDYLNYTSVNLEKIEQFCRSNKIQLLTEELQSSKTIDNWNKISHQLEKLDDEVLLDVTTIPREQIWTMLFILKQRGKPIHFIYHKPEKYCHDWLSREPGKPRLLLKHSGIVEFDKPTLLLIITGFDPERTRQLIYYYEPKNTVLLIQKGDQFENKNRNNKQRHIEECVGLTDYEDYEIDGYNIEETFNTIETIIRKYQDDYNIVATSLGPKISALTLYKNYHYNDSIALTYVPCKEYNINYSSGISGEISGTINLLPQIVSYKPTNVC